MDTAVITAASPAFATAAMDCALSQVVVRYPGGAAALDAISLNLARGEQVAIIGPSGAGKTTLLRTFGCAMRPDAGEVRVLGEHPWSLDGRALHRFRRRIFTAPQMPPLPPRQRVIHAVLAGRLPQWTMRQALQSLIQPRDTGEAAHALARFRVEDKLFLRSDRLSGGERQRVGLARLLLSDAALLLLDEPVSALDPALAHDALQALQEEARARNATMVVSLHAVDLALARFDRLIGLREGRVAFDLPRADVTDAMLDALYGRELGTAFQEPPAADAARIRVSRCL